MPNTFVVSSAPIEVGAHNLCRAILGYKNLLNTSSYIVADQDPSYPFLLAHDFKTNTEYSPLSNSGSVEINIYNAEPLPVSYIGIFSKNASDCNLSVKVELANLSTGVYEEIVTRGSFGNAKPQMIYWEERQAVAIKITLYFSSKCYIASLSIGQAIVFSRPPSAGYQPARNASLDEVSNFSTDGNNFIQGRRLKNGFEEKAPINYQTYDWLDGWWAEFMNHVLDSKPIYFMANNQIQTNCVFGLQNPQSLTKPNYKNKQHVDIDLEVRGWA